MAHDESEPVMAQMWERLEKYDRELLAKAIGIPEAQLALTRCSSVVLKLLGALGHTTSAELEKKRIEQEKIALEIKKYEATRQAMAQQVVQQRYSHYSEVEKTILAAYHHELELVMQRGDAARATELQKRLQQMLATISARNTQSPIQHGIAGVSYKKSPYGDVL